MTQGPLRGPRMPGYLMDLPAAPVGAPLPPAPAAPLADAQAPIDNEGLESVTRTIPFVIPNGEAPVWSTTRRWKAIDVYLTASAVNPAFRGMISVFVYAVAGSSRSLVASGRVELGDPSNFGSPLSVGTWVTGARSASTRYEVTWLLTLTSGSYLNNQALGSLTFACVASDYADPLPPGVGEWITSPDTAAPSNNAYNSFPPRLQLVSFTATNTTAAARYVHLYDRISQVITSGYTNAYPLASWGLRAGIGETLAMKGIGFRARGAIRLILSTTPTTTTPAGDGQLAAVFR